jgi:hypothetical protein
MTRMISILCLLLCAVLGLSACQESSPELQIEALDHSLEITATQPVQVIELQTEGQALWTHRLAVPTEQVHVPWKWEPGQSMRIRALTEGEWIEGQIDLPVDPSPLTVRVEAPLGQTGALLQDGDSHSFPLIEGQTASIGIRIWAREAGEVELTVGEEPAQLLSLIEGEEILKLIDIDSETSLRMTVGDHDFSARLLPVSTTREALTDELELVSWILPSDSSGQPDPARPDGRIDLPSAWWETLLRETSLGFRPRDVEVPWAWQAVRLQNKSDRDISIAILAQVIDEDGNPDPAFRPRVRQGSDGTNQVQALLHIPAGQDGTATLPLFVDDTLLKHPSQLDRPRTRRLTITPLGSSETLMTLEEPLTISRGSTVASLGFIVVGLVSLMGLIMLVWAAPRWVRTASTSDLATISMFGTLLFGVSAATQLASMSISSLLGPFAVLVTGLVDDALRVTLLATLITLRPKIGTVTLAVLVAWLLRGMSFGAFSVSGLIFLFSRLLWLELFFWIFGLSRNGRWREQRVLLRWARLAGALGLSSLLSQASGLVLSVVLYRLFLADWYIGLMLALPGLLYPVIACAVAIPVADGLRRVES